ncbi:MAG: aminotransferase class V-fold PLP-dependent enzyme [Kiritimatiellae bacterium]|nr:aminotransferase class V-fold PLP-dependent enzyme [Kiritimatiellia bacterium]
MSDVSSVKIPAGLVYLDNNATTACSPEVVAAMQPYWAVAFGNASSAHFAGRLAGRVIEASRATIAGTLDIDPGQVFFTSGATEGNNWIFQAFADSKPEARRVVVSAIEHKSVLNAAKRLEGFGFDVSVLPVTPSGVVDLAAACELIRPGVGLVSVQLANNETGVIQPVRELVELAHAAGAFFHCDQSKRLARCTSCFPPLTLIARLSAHIKFMGRRGWGSFICVLALTGFRFQCPSWVVDRNTVSVRGQPIRLALSDLRRQWKCCRIRRNLRSCVRGATILRRCSYLLSLVHSSTAVM